MARRRTSVFLKESVILFGYLNGIWLAVGVNPGRELLDVAHALIERLVRGTLVEITFVLLPLALLAAALWAIWRRGRWLGFLAVGLAFLGGAEVLTNAVLSFALLAAGIALGFVATA